MATTNNVLNKLSVAPKEVSYLNKSFVDFKGDLITFIKNYYPNTWTDFNEANPGMIMLELAAYVGDVLSFYVDNSFKENLLAYAEQEGNIISISQAMGYKPKTIIPSTAEVLMSQLVPALDAQSGYIPDANYFLKIDKNSTVSTLSPNIVTFRTTEIVDFADPTNRVIAPRQLDPVTLLPTYYLVTKKVKVIAGNILQESFNFGDPEKFSTITIGDENITAISSVVDSDGYEWHEVDYLAQDTIIDDREISYTAAVSESISPNYAIKFRTVPRRFVTRLTTDKRTQLIFGSGRGNASEDIVYLDSQQVANSEYASRLASVSLSNTDLLNTDNFGLAPTNTTLTVTYFSGGGVESNVPSGTVVQVGQLNVLNRTTEFNSTELALFNEILNTVTVFNEMPATGGQSGESVEEIRQRALASYSAQNRIVTRRDYEARTLAMPARYGAVAKVFAISDSLQSKIQQETSPEQVDANIRQYVENNPKPNAINLYLLGYNQSKKITTLNSLVKTNLQQYLSQYRMLTDQVNILDAFVVNIGVNFDITVFKNYNMSDVVAVCLGAIKDYFDIDKWNINQPIRLGDISLLLNAQDGVQSVNRLEIVNKYFTKDGRDYQPYRYDIAEATVDGVIYPSLDPCIFEIRYPEDDIVGSAKTMRLFITSSADTTLYERFPTTNAGLDEILEVGKVAAPDDLEVAYTGSAARTIINFTLPVSGTIPETASFYLNLKIANAQNLQYQQELKIYEISGSWAEGSGYSIEKNNVRIPLYISHSTEYVGDFDPTKIVATDDGATWNQNNTSVSWSMAGGSYYANPTQSVVVSDYPLEDLRIDVTDIMYSVLVDNRDFKGFLVKLSPAYETSSLNKSNIKFFSRQTHTVHEPILEAVWNTNTFSTGSLKAIPNTYDIEVVPKNPKETYIRGSKERIRFVVRDKYPQKNFDATLRYKNVYYLPTSSYFGIVDRQAGTTISPIDAFAKLDCDATGSYFVLDTSNLYKNRSYAVNLEIDNGSSDKNIIPEIFTFWVK